MELRDRIFGPIAEASEDGVLRSVNIAALVRRLILFDHVYVETSLLREIPFLLKAFGYKGLLQLLDEPDFEFISDALTAGSVGQSIIAQDRPMGVLPLNEFDVSVVRLHEPGKQFEAALKNVEKIDMKAKRRRKLIRKLEDKLIRYPTDGAAGVADYQTQLREYPESILPAIRYSVATQLGAEPVNNIKVQVAQLNFDRGFRVSTNLVELYHIDEQAAHRVVERALLGIAGVNQRLEIMKALNAMTGFQPKEVALLKSKLDFTMKSLAPDIQEARFDRIVKVAGLPDLANLNRGNVIDVEALLKLRKRRDCVEMRQWLRTLDGSSDAEISRMFSSLHERLARVTHSRGGAIARFLFTNGIGMISYHGAVLGPVSSVIDQFVVEKLIGEPGAITFLSEDYRSLF